MFEVAVKGRVFMICASGEEEMWEWIRAIQDVVSKLPPPSDDQGVAPVDGGDDD